jgi:hypothetical protein
LPARLVVGAGSMLAIVKTRWPAHGVDRPSSDGTARHRTAPDGFVASGVALDGQRNSAPRRHPRGPHSEGRAYSDGDGDGVDLGAARPKGIQP